MRGGAAPWHSRDVADRGHGAGDMHSWTTPINRKGGSYDVSEAECLQQASLSRRAKPRLVERML
jgi:hypothetical protein